MGRIIAYFVGFTVGCLFMIMAIGCTAHADEARVFKRLSQSIVKIEDPEGGVGTGFVIWYRGAKHVLTNNHVCGNAKIVNVYYRDRPAFPLVVARKSPRADLCLIAGQKEKLRYMRALRIGHASSPNEEFFTAGYPFGRNYFAQKATFMTETEGGYAQVRPVDRCLDGSKPFKSEDGFAYLCEVPSTIYVTNARVYPGCSGSPLINQFTEVIGVVWGYAARTNQALTVPLKEVRRFLYGD